MANRLHIERFCNDRSRRVLYAVAIVTTSVILSQLLVVPYENYISLLSRANFGVMFMTVNTTLSNESPFVDADIVSGKSNSPSDSGLDRQGFPERGGEGMHGGHKYSSEQQTGAKLENEKQFPSDFAYGKELASDQLGKISVFEATENHSIQDGLKNGFELTEKVNKAKANVTQGRLELVSEISYSSLPYTTANVTLLNNGQKDQSTDKGDDLLQSVSVSPNNSSIKTGTSVRKKSKRKPTSISDMNTLLHHSLASANSLRSKMLSARDKELQKARIQIERAPIIRNAPDVYASLFRNYSMFKRSYELMERLLRVYIYKEGRKPIFHQPRLGGIYASEGWFMKLMEGNRQFVVRDPRKAHLFYLPFSSLNLREMLHQQNFQSHKDLENHLNNYVRVITGKYNFWNRTEGADHFLVGCHDWATRLTWRGGMESCLRALCNSNIAIGFQIGKDVSLPVTYIHSAENPTKDIGGNHPSERPTLAFFAGGMHGYLRPILLHYWNNKEPDMKIFGPLPRDTKGKAQYREFMKSSKYCICARGYEVHTPRVVESIYHECVPVIISDNYVPPFFEILNWESFAVFVLEEDVPNLRSILLSIPEKRYIEMQKRLKLVQQHFIWHKIPVKYDLFHMILHSIWYNRVFQANS